MGKRLDGGRGWWGGLPFTGTLGETSPSLPLCFLATHEVTGPLHHALLPRSTEPPQAQSSRAKQPLSEALTPRAHRSPSSFSVDFYGYLVTVTEC